MTTDRDIWTDEQLLLTAEEAAKALSVGRTTLYALIKEGKLRSVHIGRSCRLTRAELVRYVERLTDLPVNRHPFVLADGPNPRRLRPVCSRRAGTRTTRHETGSATARSTWARKNTLAD